MLVFGVHPMLFALKSSFFPPSVRLLLLAHQRCSAPATAPKFSMCVASKQAYICHGCRYIYNERTPFEKLPDSYFCPICAAPKRRFRPYEPKVAKNANDTAVRKARKEQTKRDEAASIAYWNCDWNCCAWRSIFLPEQHISG